MYLNQCPNSPGIPILLLMNGSFNVFFFVFVSIHYLIDKTHTLFRGFLIFLGVVSIAGFFACKSKTGSKMNRFIKKSIYETMKYIYYTFFRNYDLDNTISFSYIRL
jgi:hypothetical protein